MTVERPPAGNGPPLRSKLRLYRITVEERWPGHTYRLESRRLSVSATGPS